MKHNKNKKLIKLASRFQPWDFGFNLEIERAMFKRMYEFFSSDDPVVLESERIAEKIGLAIALLDIILEEDTAITYVQSHLGIYEWRLTKYINYKNANRFGNFPKEEDVTVKEYLRQHKAWSLYHKLRCYQMQHWWD